MKKPVSTLSGLEYSFERVVEFAENGEPLEVKMDGIENARIRSGKHLSGRFASFLPFDSIDTELSLGEENTSLLTATRELRNAIGINVLFLQK